MFTLQTRFKPIVPNYVQEFGLWPRSQHRSPRALGLKKASSHSLVFTRYTYIQSQRRLLSSHPPAHNILTIEAMVRTSSQAKPFAQYFYLFSQNSSTSLTKARRPVQLKINYAAVKKNQGHNPPPIFAYLNKIRNIWRRFFLFLLHRWAETWARICKRWRRPGINSEESILPAYVAWQVGTTNRVVVPARQAGNRFLGPLKRHGNEADFIGFLHIPVRHRSLTLRF